MQPAIEYIKASVEAILNRPYQLKVNIPSYRKDWIAKIRQVPHAKWNKQLKYWTIPYCKAELRIFHGLFKGEQQYLLKIKADIPESYQLYFEECFPKALVIIRADNSELFKIYVPKEAEAWQNIIKQIPGRKWHRYESCWKVPYVKYSFRHLKKHFAAKLRIEMNINSDIPDFFEMPTIPPKKILPKPYDLLSPKQKNAITAIEERLIIERKSWRTIKTYKAHLIGLFRYFPDTLPSKISAEQIKNYMLFKIRKNNIGERTQEQIMNSFAAFYNRFLKQENKLSLLKRPRQPKDLPNVFSTKEIELLLTSIQNIKHKTIIMMIYSSGLRKNELRNLRKQDVLFSRKSIFVKNAKGKKDRYVILADKLTEFLKIYLGLYNPKYWLFEGLHGGQYSETSVQSIYMNAKIKSNVNPNVTLHGLRHSFATHLVENNVPLHVVKDLLGHTSIKTTQVYLHISDKMRKGIKSPLDYLNI
jgi:integrase/recombinase XerD